MRYISTFSGIEAASVAWRGLGWEPVAFSEIDPFPCAVLKERFHNVPNLGDITKIDWRPYRGTVDVVVGGSPCQSFSIAGARESLDGESRLMFEWLRCVGEVLPRVVIWENVPGVLNTKDNAFGQLLGTLAELGYHDLSYRVLDAQFFGVAQRRRRVFVVSYLGENRFRSAAVLFNAESVSGNTQSSREKRAEFARTVENISHDGGGVITICGADDNGKAAIDFDLCGTLKVYGSAPYVSIIPASVVRRLTPKECERLQGFPDDWTKVPYRGKPESECPDGPRYKALGNSFAVPVVRWIGERIQMLDDMGLA